MNEIGYYINALSVGLCRLSYWISSRKLSEGYIDLLKVIIKLLFPPPILRISFICLVCIKKTADTDDVFDLIHIFFIQVINYNKTSTVNTLDKCILHVNINQKIIYWTNQNLRQNNYNILIHILNNCIVTLCLTQSIQFFFYIKFI